MRKHKDKISNFTKLIKTEIPKKVILIESSINIDQKYFIKKIEEGISNSDNKNFVTNVFGQMTSWNFFNEDDEFLNVLIKIFDIFDVENLIEKSVLKESWGIKLNKGNFTKLHDHKEAVLSGVLYLNDSDQELFFPELQVSVKPEIGKIIIFSGILKHYTNRIYDDSSKYAIAFNMYQMKSW
jgi:hypothetical protein